MRNSAHLHRTNLHRRSSVERPRFILQPTRNSAYLCSPASTQLRLSPHQAICATVLPLSVRTSFFGHSPQRRHYFNFYSSDVHLSLATIFGISFSLVNFLAHLMAGFDINEDLTKPMVAIVCYDKENKIIDFDGFTKLKDLIDQISDLWG